MSVIGIVGGGTLGCCAALELAARGRHSVLIDTAPALLGGATRANEGKLHFGHVYPRDHSMATARLMLRGALHAAPALRRWVGDAAVAGLRRGPGFRYAVHRDSLSTPEDVLAHFRRIPELARGLLGGRPADCFGADPLAPPRILDRADGCDPAHIQALYQTDEINLDNRAMAEALRLAVAAEPRIETLLSTRVTGGQLDPDHVTLNLQDAAGGAGVRRFDHVINASWTSRLALDATVGLVPPQAWMFRLKHLVRLDGAAVAMPAITVCVGPFGDVVPLPGVAGGLALSWYPAGRIATSTALAPPAEWPARLQGEVASRLARRMVEGLGRLFPTLLGLLDTPAMAAAEVSGGVIYALGGSDVDDAASDLHSRHALGRRSQGRWHSVDPGKWTTCPLFATEVAEHIAPTRRPAAA